MFNSFNGILYVLSLINSVIIQQTHVNMILKHIKILIHLTMNVIQVSSAIVNPIVAVNVRVAWYLLDAVHFDSLGTSSLYV